MGCPFFSPCLAEEAQLLPKAHPSLCSLALISPSLIQEVQFRISKIYILSLFYEFGPFYTVGCCCYVYSCVFVRVRDQHGLPSSISLRLIFWDRLFWNLELASEPPKSYPYLLHTGAAGVFHCARLFMWAWWIQTQIFMLHGKLFDQAVSRPLILSCCQHCTATYTSVSV